MADRRITQVLIDAEYNDATNNRRITQVLVQPEYTGATNYRRITQILIQVEYHKNWYVKRFGPMVQVVG
jgi:hypothetical protein